MNKFVVLCDRRRDDGTFEESLLQYESFSGNAFFSATTTSEVVMYPTAQRAYDLFDSKEFKETFGSQFEDGTLCNLRIAEVSFRILSEEEMGVLRL